MNRLVKIVLLFSIPVILSSCIFDDEEEKWDAAKVCPETGTNSYGMPNRGTFTDERDGQVYKYTTIGKQVWMAENLRYELPYPYSMCYGIEACYWHKRWESDDVGETSCFKDTASLAEIAKTMRSSCADNDCIAEEYCKKFGRYYSLKEGGEYAGLLDRVVVDTVCPRGWHVPSKEEWEILIDNIEGNLSRLLIDKENLFEENDLLTKLYGSERDVCGFSALYAGRVQSDEIILLFNSAIYWTSTARNPVSAEAMYLNTGSGFGIDGRLNSLRCLKD